MTDSDNINRTPTDEETATVGTAGFDLRARREGQRLTYRADSNLDYLNYLDTDLSDQVVGRFDGSAIRVPPGASVVDRARPLRPDQD